LPEKTAGFTERSSATLRCKRPRLSPGQACSTYLKLSARRAALPGKEEICLLRPLSPLTRRGLQVALTVTIRLALRLLRALHLTVFDQPAKWVSFSTLLVSSLG
jgi:hypothetical protein